MAFSDLNHFTNRHDVPLLFNQGLSNLEVIYGISKLSDNTENVLLNEMTERALLLRRSAPWCRLPRYESRQDTESLVKLGLGSA